MKRDTSLLKYGSRKIGINMPSSAVLPEIRSYNPGIDKSSIINNLVSLLPRRNAGKLLVVVSDKTRLCGYGEYLPWLVEAAAAKGFSTNDITFIIAYGTHPAQSEEESLHAYGDSFRQLNFVHHNCDDHDSMVTVGTTSRGTAVTVRKEVIDSEAIILFGAISHHYFAGYGGGRKLIFPGLASRESIYHNHKLFIDFERGTLHPGCQSGRLDGNPVAEDLKEIDSMLPSKIIISGILDKRGEVVSLVTGSNYQDFISACSTYDNIYRKTDLPLFDLVVASSGGYPKDINFIQTHKSIHNAASFVKDGGTLILLAECRDGLGNDSFIRIFEKSRAEAVQSLRENYSGNGGTALSMMAKTERIKIYMVTSLDEPACKKLGVEKIEEEEVDKVINSVKGDAALLENASIIYR